MLISGALHNTYEFMAHSWDHDWLTVDTSAITFGIIIENLDERIFARSNATFLQGINPKY